MDATLGSLGYPTIVSPKTKPKKTPLRQALEKAPVDDELLSDDERGRIKRARDEAKRGDVVTTEELTRRLGL
jgi:hypothetical protein